MQQQKLITCEEELVRFKAEAAEKRASVLELSATCERDAENARQERETWRVQEAELTQKVAKDRRELEEFKRKTSMDRLREKTQADEQLLQLRVQLQRLQDEA